MLGEKHNFKVDSQEARGGGILDCKWGTPLALGNANKHLVSGAESERKISQYTVGDFNPSLLYPKIKKKKFANWYAFYISRDIKRNLRTSIWCLKPVHLKRGVSNENFCFYLLRLCILYICIWFFPPRKCLKPKQHLGWLATSCATLKWPDFQNLSQKVKVIFCYIYMIM